jgi:hypothetical protein
MADAVAAAVASIGRGSIADHVRTAHVRRVIRRRTPVVAPVVPRGCRAETGNRANVVDGGAADGAVQAVFRRMGSRCSAGSPRQVGHRTVMGPRCRCSKFAVRNTKAEAAGAIRTRKVRRCSAPMGNLFASVDAGGGVVAAVVSASGAERKAEVRAVAEAHRQVMVATAAVAVAVAVAATAALPMVRPARSRPRQSAH